MSSGRPSHTIHTTVGRKERHYVVMQVIKERLEKCVKPISDAIPRTGLYTFSNRPPVDKAKTKNQLSTKIQVSLITKVFMSSQSRPGSDMEHENAWCPPSISEKEKLYHGTKSDIVECIPGMPKPGGNSTAKMSQC